MPKVTRTEIGRYLYAFSNKMFVPTSGADCVLFAHGCRRIRGGTFRVPTGMTLHFYAAEGQKLGTRTRTNETPLFGKRYDNSAPEMIAMGLVDSVESYGALATVGNNGHEVPDYYLTKPVGRHSSTPREVGGQVVNEQWGMEYEDIERFLSMNYGAMDILTVRHRGISGITCLKTAINTIKKSGKSYTNIHVAICRTNLAQACGRQNAEGRMVEFPPPGVIEY